MTTEGREREWEERLLAVLESNEPDELAHLLEDVHGADLATFFPELDETQQLAVLEALDDEQAAILLDELEPEDRERTLDLLSIERTSDILDEMPSDEAADLLAELSTEEADALLGRMEPEQAEDVADLMRYSEDVAGGLMAKEFVAVGPDQTVAEVLALLRRHHDDAEMIYYCYVLDEEERLLGVVTLRKLIITDPEAVVSDIMAREFISVPPDMPQQEVAEEVRRHDLLAIPVVDEDGRMLGIITVDDVGDVVREEAAEDLLEISGAEEPEERPTVLPRIRGWRSGLLALAGGILGTALIWMYARVLDVRIDAAIMLPLMLVLGITTASQAALAIDQAHERIVERHQLGRIFLREVITGLVLAIIGGLLAGLLLFVLNHRHGRDVLVAIPLALGLWTASIMGTLGSVLLQRFNRRLGTTTHTIIVAVALLVAVVVYLLVTREIL